jgi:hypothetical protein
LKSEKDIKSYPYLDITTHKRVGAKTLVWEKNENMVLEGEVPIWKEKMVDIVFEAIVASNPKIKVD